MLLINPKSNFWFTYPHLGTAYLASCLNAIGEKTEIFDCQYEPDYMRRLMKTIKSHLNVGITVNVANISNALEIAQTAKKFYPEKKIIMGGPLATVNYQYYLNKYADIIVLGEGEKTIKEIATTKNLSKIKGIAYWDNEIKITQKRELITDLDSIPYPGWHLVELSKYRPPVARTIATMMTSRGCPFDCINCTKLIHGYNYRERSIDNILGEIDLLNEKFKIKEIHFWDDLFTYKPQRVKDLCQAIIKRKYKRLRLAVPSGIRADIIDKEMFALMQQAGFYGLTVAIESGSQKIIDSLGKKLDLAKVNDAINVLKKFKFKIGAFFMLGTPQDTLETMQETLNFAKRLKVHHAYFFITLPIPGTKLYDLVKEKGKFLQDLTFLSRGYDDGKATYEIGELRAKDVETMLKRSYREFYFRPSQLLRTIFKSLRDPASFIYACRQGLRLLLKGRRI